MDSVQCGSLDSVRFLMNRREIDPQGRRLIGGHNQTALEYARSSGKVDIVELLLSNPDRFHFIEPSFQTVIISKLTGSKSTYEMKTTDTIATLKWKMREVEGNIMNMTVLVWKSSSCPHEKKRPKNWDTFETNSWESNELFAMMGKGSRIDCKDCEEQYIYPYQGPDPE